MIYLWCVVAFVLLLGNCLWPQINSSCNCIVFDSDTWNVSFAVGFCNVSDQNSITCSLQNWLSCTDHVYIRVKCVTVNCYTFNSLLTLISLLTLTAITVKFPDLCLWCVCLNLNVDTRPSVQILNQLYVTFVCYSLSSGRFVSAKLALCYVTLLTMVCLLVRCICFTGSFVFLKQKHVCLQWQVLQH